MVNNGETDIPEDRRLDVEERVCTGCKKSYIPQKSDISTKNPNMYYKQCTPCRKKMQEYMAAYLKRSF